MITFTVSKLFTWQACPTLKETFQYGMVEVIDAHVIQRNIRTFWGTPSLPF